MIWTLDGVAPVIGDTLNPTMIPTLYPTNYPTITPTNNPTSIPTTNPSKYPTTDPTVDPTMIPTIDPTIDPTSGPTFMPSSPPTVYPTLDPTNNPSTDPSNDPTSNPTFYPTNEPTLSPTLCHNAKYQWRMEENDALWGGESFVSKNCRYVLNMDKNGPLILYGSVGDDIWYKGWYTNTTLFNYSRGSTPKFYFKNGRMFIDEWAYRGVTTFDPIPLWNSSLDDVSSDISLDEVSLILTDTACLSLMNDQNQQIWSKCISYTGNDDIVSTQYMITTQTTDIDTDIVDKRKIEHGESTKERNDRLWWVYLLVCIFILMLFVICFGVKKYICDKDPNNWITPRRSDLDKYRVRQATKYAFDESDAEDEGAKINKWISGTKQGNAIEPGFHHSVKSNDYSENEDSIELVKLHGFVSIEEDISHITGPP